MPGTVRSLAFSPDGKMFLITLTRFSLSDPAVLRLEPRTGADLSPRLQGVTDLQFNPSQGAFSRKGGWVAAGRLWDSGTGKQLFNLEGGSTAHYVFAPDDRR